MNRGGIRKITPLVLISGLCALTYQVVWLRELRLVFGSSTAATGMVLAIFMGGLGFGAVIFGRLADRVKRPLVLYGYLELGISLTAALSPLLIILVRKLYLGLGGAMGLGLPFASGMRVLLTAVVLGLPTLLMGGTLPAVARAVETAADRGRRDFATLYGVNTIGGVFGVGLATFLLLELLGNRTTLWSVALLNGLVGGSALLLARKWQPTHIEATAPAKTAQVISTTNERLAVVPTMFLYGSAFVTGFVFLLMELVWYRLLSPLLGGSTYTFGLILALALTGIGLGGALFGTRHRGQRTTVTAFTIACSLEALFLAVPFGMGDRLAVMAGLLKPLAVIGFSGQIVAWVIVASILVLPAAIMAGMQFPMLIGLLGQGKREVGRHTGSIYGWNTSGAILGSLAGGFGLIPLLTAPGCWQLVVLLLVMLSAGGFLFAATKEGKRPVLMLPVAILIASVLLLNAEGPTAAWRHSAIGIGNYVNLTEKTPNELREWLNKFSREVFWEMDGVESSVAMRAYNGLSFIVNGKPDGNAVGDVGTQVMGPLVGAILHPDPKKGLVIGLGTGSSAGWLAEVPTMELVKVVEIEPAILEVARRCAPVNFNVLDHPKVRVIVGDGREVVQTLDEKFDVIFSEPSNPYRAGIASLYTREFYRTIAERLAPEGIFSQWLQTYQVDTQTVRTIIATLASVFSDVEIWFTDENDILFVCSMAPKQYSASVLRQRLTTEPFRSGMLNGWGVVNLEGFLAGFVARGEVARLIAEQEIAKGRINTDDRMLADFGFARTAGRTGIFPIEEMVQTVRGINGHRPVVIDGDVNWDLVDEKYFQMMLWHGKKIRSEDGFSIMQLKRAAIFGGFIQSDFTSVLGAWQDGVWTGEDPQAQVVLAEALAEAGDERSLALADSFRINWPTTANVVTARYHWRRQEKQQAFAALKSALRGAHSSPWHAKGAIIHLLQLTMEMAHNEDLAKELFELLAEPFSAYVFEEYRKFALVQVAKNIDPEYAVRALAQLEPHVPWREPLLRFRDEIYAKVSSPLAEQAAEDLRLFLSNKPAPFLKRQETMLPSEQDDLQVDRNK